MNGNRKHSQSDLTDALEHVVYEIWKYKQAVAHYSIIMSTGGDAALEFRILHHRVLLEFFHCSAKHPDSVVACDYIDGWEITHDPASLPWFGRYMKRCHTMLAHISITRSVIAKLDLKSWASEWRIVEPYLDRAICDFLRGLPENQRNICLEWVNRWSVGRYPGNDVLKDLAATINGRNGDVLKLGVIT